MTTSQSPIVVDGVFFQLGRTGIARVWMTLLGLWAPTEFGRRLVVIDRARTAPRVPGIRYHDAPALNYADLEGDRRVVQQVCDEVGRRGVHLQLLQLPAHHPVGWAWCTT